jgi:hypothetical protein
MLLLNTCSSGWRRGNGEYDLLALEASLPFIARGHIPPCGDVLLAGDYWES